MEEKVTTEVSVVGVAPPTLELTEGAIQTIQHNIQMAQKLVMSVLEKDIDYGRTPGTPTDSLWDPGAAKIMAAFSCYSGHKVIYHTEEDNLISWCIEAQLIRHQSQQVIATGVGAASTRETKYKYRWVDKPEEFGYDLEQIKKLKTKQSANRVLFRIENPEYGELVNTLFQMAAKRAEVDGAKSLPGVGSALKKLFSGGIKGARKEPDWAGFWGRVAQLGLSEERVHEVLGVTSVNQWIAQGKTLDQAIKTLSERLAAPGAQATKEAPVAETKSPDEVTEDDIPDLNALAKICFHLWGMQPADVWRELGYKSMMDVTQTPWECWLQIKAARGEK